uniref:BHLH domain-containing protein n=1 Tax=Romanomermis culicivorax TaxID=13658 RepID=A0A915JLD3_ROMCU
MVRKLSLTKLDTTSPSEAYSAPAGYFHSPGENMTSSPLIIGVSSPPSLSMMHTSADNHNFQQSVVGKAASFPTTSNNRSTPKIRRLESSALNYQTGMVDDWPPTTSTVATVDTEPNEILRHLMSGSFLQDDNFSGNFSVVADLNFQDNVGDGFTNNREFSSPSNVQTQAQNIINAPRCSSATISCPRAVSDSPSCASYGTSVSSELDDSVILDEILSMEEEQQLRRARIANSRSKNSEESDQPDTIVLLDEILHQNQISESNQSGRRQNLFRIREDSENSSEAAAIYCSDKEEDLSNSNTKGPVIMRDRRKKDVHNMSKLSIFCIIFLVERRRRYNINDKIRELGSLLPKSRTQDMKMNKGSILRASVEYLRVVNHNQERMLELVKQQQNFEVEHKRMMSRIQELEQELRSHGLVVPACSPDFPKSPVKSTATVNPFVNVVKTEPIDDETYIRHCVDLTMSQSNGLLYDEITCGSAGRPSGRHSRQQKLCDSRQAIRNVINARVHDPSLGTDGGHSLYNENNSNSDRQRGSGPSNVKSTLAGRRQPSSSVIRDLLLSQVTTRRDGTPTAIASVPCTIPLSPSSSPAVQRPSASSSANAVPSSSAVAAVDSLTSYLLNDFCSPPTSYAAVQSSDVGFNYSNPSTSNDNRRLMNDVLNAAAAIGPASYAPSPVHLSTLLGGVGDDDWCMIDDVEGVGDSSSNNNFNFDSTTRDQADFVLA